MTRDPTAPKILLHADGAAVALLALLLYRELGANWLLFALLVLAPDVAMLGYLAGARVGAAAYNAAHTYLAPVALFGAGFLAELSLPMVLALIWATHIGVDRLLGFGLKYPSGFKDTHMQRVR